MLGRGLIDLLGKSPYLSVLFVVLCRLCPAAWIIFGGLEAIKRVFPSLKLALLPMWNSGFILNWTEKMNMFHGSLRDAPLIPEGKRSGGEPLISFPDVQTASFWEEGPAFPPVTAVSDLICLGAQTPWISRGVNACFFF